MLDIKQLEYFVEIIHCQSLNKAAKNLFISQAALTKSMRSLENELGVQLLNRSRIGVTPTAIGERIYKDALKMLAIRQQWDSYQKQPLYTDIPIAATPEVYQTLVNKLMIELYRDNKYLTLFPVEVFFSDILDSVYHSPIRLTISCDCAEETVFPMTTLHKHQLEKTFLFQDEYCAFVHPEHPLADVDAVSITELKKYPAILMNKEEYVNPLLYQQFHDFEYSRIPGYVINMQIRFQDNHELFTIWPRVLEDSQLFAQPAFPNNQYKILRILGLPSEMLQIKYYLIHPLLDQCSREEYSIIKKALVCCQKYN